MSDLNKSIIQGRLTRDIELRYSGTGTPVASFGLASNRRYREKDETLFLDCVAFGKTAEIMSEHLKKGSPALLEGRLQTETWDDKKTGTRRSKISLIVDQFHFIGDGKTVSDTPVKAVATEKEQEKGVDDDVPF